MSSAQPDFKEKTFSVAALAASGSYVGEIYFPRDARITRYFATPSVAEAAHATQVLDVTFVNAGTDGSGSTTLAVLTNDSDLADSSTRKSSAWVAHDAKEIITSARPSLAAGSASNVYDEVTAGSVLKVTVAKAAGTTTGNVHVGVEYLDSD